MDYAFRLKENVGIGVGVKFIYKLLNPFSVGPPVRLPVVEVSGKTFAFDAGGLYKLNLDKNRKILPYINIGLSFLNLGPDIKDEREIYGREEPLPRTFKFGIASAVYESDKIRLLLSVDITKVFNNITDNLRNRGFYYVYREAWKHIGIELSYIGTIFLRAGYFHDFEGIRKGFMFGLGVRFRKLSIDIGTESFIHQIKVGNWRFSVNFSF